MRATDITLREDPTNRFTIDNQLAEGWFSPWQAALYEAIADVCVGIRNDPRPAARLGAMVPTMWSASPHEVRYGKSESELRGMLVSLETAGFRPRSIEVGDAPDGFVTLDNGEQIWVEHAEVIDPVSARYENMMHDLDRDIKDAVDADLIATTNLTGHHVEMRFSGCPAKSEIRDVRKAIIGLIRDGEHLAMPERTLTKLTAPALKAIGTTLYRAPWPHGATGGSPYIVHLQEGAHSFSPISLAPIAMRRLEAKQKLAPRYGVKPLWLTLSVNDLRGVWDASMKYLAGGCPPIAPFGQCRQNRTAGT